MYSFIADDEMATLVIKLDREELHLHTCAYKLLYDQLTQVSVSHTIVFVDEYLFSCCEEE